jgi:3-phenylpropionate/cinnamic acid dioxygenase small subunit
VSSSVAAEIRDVLARHAELFDNRVEGGFSSAYTAEATIGGETGPLAPIAEIGSGAAPGRVFFPHHTTDVALHRVDDVTVRAWSKYLVIRGDGTAGSGDYQDTLVHTPDGWRIAERRVSRGSRPETDPDGPSQRSFTAGSWRRPTP